MAIIMEPKKRIDASLNNLPQLCTDIIHKKNRRVGNLSMSPEKYLEDKKEKLIEIAKSIKNDEERKAMEDRINSSFKKAESMIWNSFDGKEFDMIDRDLI